MYKTKFKEVKDRWSKVQQVDKVAYIGLFIIFGFVFIYLSLPALSTLAGVLQPNPKITITSPAKNTIATDEAVLIEGIVYPFTATVYIDSQRSEVGEDGSFSSSVNLDGGANRIKISARRKYASTDITWNVIRELTEEEEEVARLKEKEIEEIFRSVELKMEMENDPESFIEVISNNWHMGGFGSIPIHTLKIENKGKVDYKDIKVRASYFSPSKTPLGLNTYTIYDTLPAGATKTFREINMGFIDSQASTSRIEVLGASVL
jgi:hypothetical protein